ncbi:MAG: hypothetical protein HYV13_03150 [Candidatus Doudnabacteria bacterium]|nr:hypothetical protein [Candidatus Doudnabacteria bacterium]
MTINHEFKVGDRVRFSRAGIGDSIDLSEERVAQLRQKIAQLKDQAVEKELAVDQQIELEASMDELDYILLLSSNSIYCVVEKRTQCTIFENTSGVSKEVLAQDIKLEDVFVPNLYDELFPVDWFELA